MKTIAVMPLKLNNERLPGKNTKLLAGKPLLQWSLEALKKCARIDEIYVYCSDKRIMPLLGDGIHFLERPAYLDLPTSNFSQIFEEFMRIVNADVYVYAHATAPFVSAETICELIDAVHSGEYDSAFCASKIQDFLWKDGRPLNFDAQNLPRSQDIEPIFRETSGVYVFTKQVFTNEHRRIGCHPYVKEVSYREAVDINTYEDFALAESLASVTGGLAIDKKSEDMGCDRVKVLDVTLRDGGCVNDFNFGVQYMNNILDSLVSTKVDYIEVGYLDETKGSVSARTKFVSDGAVENFLKGKNASRSYLAMMDYGRFTARNLIGRKSDSLLVGIRLAFHKKDRKAMLSIGRDILQKGYRLFVQPMLTMRYSDAELLDLINDVKNELPETAAIYIVDSFGEMREDDLARLAKLYEENVPETMSIGFHSHNNLQLSYALAMKFIAMKLKHQIIVDSAVMGMGKGAGNLCTELLLEHMNLKVPGEPKYEITPLLSLMDKVLKVLQQEFPWGYSPEYYLSSFYHCTPSYAAYFYAKQMLPLEQVGELLGKIEPHKAISFDKNYAEQLYSRFRAETSVDDSATVEKIASTIVGKRVLLIAPGKSIGEYADEISELVSMSDIVSIALNNMRFDATFYLITRNELLNDSKHKGKIIITSRERQDFKGEDGLV